MNYDYVLEPHQKEVEIGNRQRKAQAVYEIEDSTDSRQELSGVLHLETTLQDGLREIPRHGRESHEQSKNGDMMDSEPVETRSAQSMNGKGPSLRKKEGAYVAFPRFGRTDVRDGLVPADQGSYEVGPHVGELGHQDHEEDKPEPGFDGGRQEHKPDDEAAKEDGNVDKAEKCESNRPHRVVALDGKTQTQDEGSDSDREHSCHLRQKVGSPQRIRIIEGLGHQHSQKTRSHNQSPAPALLPRCLPGQDKILEAPEESEGCNQCHEAPECPTQKDRHHDTPEENRAGKPRLEGCYAGGTLAGRGRHRGRHTTALTPPTQCQIPPSPLLHLEKIRNHGLTPLFYPPARPKPRELTDDMKKTLQAFSLVLGLLATGSINSLAEEDKGKKKPRAERGERPEGERRGPPRGGARQIPKEILEKFDKNGDGKLDEDERKEAQRARRAEFLKKYDKDGDGELSEEERKEAMKGRRGRGRPQGDRPEGGRPEGKKPGGKKPGGKKPGGKKPGGKKPDA